MNQKMKRGLGDQIYVIPFVTSTLLDNILLSDPASLRNIYILSIYVYTSI